MPSKHQCLTRACLSAACCNKLQAPPLGGQRRCNGHVAGDYWARHPCTGCRTGLKRQAGARHSAMTSDPATRNRTRDHLITAKCLQSDALPTEL